MSLKITLLSCALLFTGANAIAQDANNSKKEETPVKQSTTHSEATEKKSGQSDTGGVVINEDVAELLADNVDLKDPKKLSDLAKILNKSVGCETVSAEDLMYPAIELYGENSWNTNNLNITTDGSKIPLPETYEVDCSEFSYPLDGLRRVNSRYGYRRRSGRMHYGIDLQLSVGDTVRSAFDGRVRLVDYERRGYGKYVVIRHTNGLETIYGHLSNNSIVKSGDIVRAGDPIGLGGNTGRSTGPHLHLEMRLLGQPINPDQIINFDTGVPHNEIYVYKKGKDTRRTYAKKSGNSPARSGNIKVHKIQRGDTLSGIASRYGTTVSKLCELNGISRSTTLQVGRTLRVRS